MSAWSRAGSGKGFVVLLLALVGTIEFFWWGSSTPPLDEVWRIQIDLSLGQGGPLSEREFRLLQVTLRRYPELADSMLEESETGLISTNTGGVVYAGFAYAVRKRPSAPGHLEVSGIGVKRIAIAARTTSASTAGVVDGKEPLIWQVPNDGPFPQLVEIRVTGEEHKPLKRREKQPEPTGEGTVPIASPVVLRFFP